MNYSSTDRGGVVGAFRTHNHLEFGNELDENGEGNARSSSSADWKGG